MRLTHGTLLAALLIVVATPREAVADHKEVVDKLDRGRAERVSVTASGEEGDGDSGFSTEECRPARHYYSASDDGRRVTFASRSGNLHSGDANGQAFWDVFVYDRSKRTLDLVSAMPTGLASNLPPLPGRDCGSFAPVISGNGRYVAFVSDQPLTGLDIHYTIPRVNVFVRDLKGGATELVSSTWDGLPPVAPLDGSFEPSISDNGRYVAFLSDVVNLVEDSPCISTDIVPGISIPSRCRHVYIRDRKEDTTAFLSKSSAGEPANAVATGVSISGNGRFVAFDTPANNLVDNDHNTHPLCRINPEFPSCYDVFVHDLRTAKTELVSVGRDGTSAEFNSELMNTAQQQSISDDGRVVAFHSFASNLVPANPLPPSLVGSTTYVRDRKAQRTERVSVGSAGAILGNTAPDYSLTDDGRYISWFGWTCKAPLIGPSTVCPDHHEAGVFLHDRITGQTDWLTTCCGGSPNHRDEPSPSGYLGRHIGGNGRFLVDSLRYAGLENDSNDAYDVFVRDFRIARLGVGQLIAGGGKFLILGGHPAFDATEMVEITEDDDAAASIEGAEIIGATIIHRPELDDLFVRIDVERLPVVTSLQIITSPLVYGMRFTTPQGTFELRAGATGPITHASFKLFRCSGNACTEAAKVKGGYGTVGENVVAALPLSHLGLSNGGEISEVEVFSELGTYHLGATTSLHRFSVRK